MCCDLPRSTWVGCVVFAAATRESVPGHILHLRNADAKMLCANCIQFPSSHLPFTCRHDNRLLGTAASGSRNQRELRPAPCTHPTSVRALSARGDALGEMSGSDALGGCSGRDAVEGIHSGDACREDAMGGRSRGMLSGPWGHLPRGGRCRTRSEVAAGRGTLPLSAAEPAGAGETGAEVEGRPPTLYSLIGGRRAPVP